MKSRFGLLQPASLHADAGLFVLRLVVAGSLLIKHGLEKIFTFSAMAQHFPDPLHIGPMPSLICAMIGDSICSVLVILGLATRWAALISFVNIFVAWAFVHHFAFFGHKEDHGELIVLYLGVLLALFFTGPGRYSLDALLSRRSA